MIINIEEDPRHAGQISRFHTWPTHRTQSVGEHTWQVMRIMMTVDVGMCTTRLMHYAVLHDVGEMAGDIPWPGKRNDPVLKSQCDLAEGRVRAAMTARWDLPHLPGLSDTERSFFKVCENLEMWEFGLQEVSMGNKYGAVVASRMLFAADAEMQRLSPDLRARIRKYVDARILQESETELVSNSDPRHVGHGDPSDEAMNFVNKEEKR